MKTPVPPPSLYDVGGTFPFPEPFMKRALFDVQKWHLLLHREHRELPSRERATTLDSDSRTALDPRGGVAVNTHASEQFRSLLERRPFTVLGYSAEGSVWCPVCLRSAAGLSPGRGIDYDGKPILPLHARDEAVHGESCDNCGKLLVDILLGHDTGHVEVRPVTAMLYVYGKCWALSFEGVPPAHVRTQLKQSWRWDPRYRLWWCTTQKPEIPTGVALPPDGAPRPEVFARPPTRRRAACA